MFAFETASDGKISGVWDSLPKIYSIHFTRRIFSKKYSQLKPFVYASGPIAFQRNSDGKTNRVLGFGLFTTKISKISFPFDGLNNLFKNTCTSVIENWWNSSTYSFGKKYLTKSITQMIIHIKCNILNL